MTLTNFPNGIKTSEVVTGGSGGGSASIVFATADASGNTGSVTIESGNSSTGDSGAITIATGTASGTRGNITLDALITVVTNGQLQAPAGVEFDIASPGNGGASNTGSVFVFTGDQSGTGQSGTVGLQSGNATSDNSGPCFIGTGNSTGANSAQMTLFTGDGHSTGGMVFGTGNASAGNSGNISFATGTATGTKGNIIITGLPTADPHVVGALWIDAAASRVIKSSNG